MKCKEKIRVREKDEEEVKGSSLALGFCELLRTGIARNKRLAVVVDADVSRRGGGSSMGRAPVPLDWLLQLSIVASRTRTAATGRAVSS